MARITEKPTHTPAMQRCSACGGLACLCRPRFFAGQLLTEGDLNGLERYVIEKNRLHNRYLHGWGVVCGLDVRCYTCDPCERDGVAQLLVTEGYALSPCGEDIVVSGEAIVPVCELIEACPTTQRCDEDEDPCRDGPEQWVLAVCYDEKPTRGIAPLRAPDCGCGGGATSGGCGGNCNGSGNGSGTRNGNGYGTGTGNRTGQDTRLDRCATPLGCEPTVICESYRFTAFRAEPTPREDSRGAFSRRYTACVAQLEHALPARPTGDHVPEWKDWFARYQRAVRGYALDHPLTRCDLPGLLDRYSPSEEDFPGSAAHVADRVEALLKLMCLCSALHPPCPEPVADDCVPLAVLTLDRSGNGCRVTDVCTFTPLRRQVVTFPALGYWLSVLPFGRWLRAALSALCCDLRQRVGNSVIGVRPRREAAEDEATEGGATAEQEDTFEMRIPTRADEDVRDALRIAAALGDPWTPHSVVDAMLAAPPEGFEALYVLADQLAPPLLRIVGLGPPDELAEVRETVRRQQQQIDELLARLGGEGSA